MLGKNRFLKTVTEATSHSIVKYHTDINVTLTKTIMI